MVRVGILTCSDKGARGERQDASAAEIKKLLPEEFQVTHYAVVPDEQEAITGMLVDWCDREGLDLILTSGGTGLTPRDVAPESTLAVLEREIPGMAEAMRAEGLRHTPLAQISRAKAGFRRETLIINLPGSLKAIDEMFPVILPALPHTVEKIKGDPGDCAR